MFKASRNVFLIKQFVRHTKTVPMKMTLEARGKIYQSDKTHYKNRCCNVAVDVKDILTHGEFPEGIAIDVTKEEHTPTIVSGIPEEQIKTRHVKIFMPAKNAMQSGTYGTRNWRLEFDSQERWENPLIGWTSTGDPLSTMSFEFETAEAAAQYCDSLGLSYQIEKPNKPILKPKSYGSNFSWNKRSRVTTK